MCGSAFGRAALLPDGRATRYSMPFGFPDLLKNTAETYDGGIGATRVSSFALDLSPSTCPHFVLQPVCEQFQGSIRLSSERSGATPGQSI